jgi:hypothetical protein
MWLGGSKELMDADYVITDIDVIATMFPNEVVECVKYCIKHEDYPRDPFYKKHYKPLKYKYEGWIISNGVQGIKPGSSNEVKRQWMEFWTLSRDFPNVI